MAMGSSNVGGSSSLVNALDLVCSSACEDGEGGGSNSSSSSTSANLGFLGGSSSSSWLSPRISFSTGFVDSNSNGVVTDQYSAAAEDLAAVEDFEFCMALSAATSSIHVDGRLLDSVGSCCTSSSSTFKPADELFHKGKLRPLSVLPPSRNQLVMDYMQILQEQPSSPPPLERPTVTNVALESSLSTSRTSTTTTTAAATASTAWFVSRKNVDSSSVPGKAPRWREVFGLLRRARSDGGRYHEHEDHHQHQALQKRQSSSSMTSSSLRFFFKRPQQHAAVLDNCTCSDLQAKKLAEAPENLPRRQVASAPPPAAASEFVVPPVQLPPPPPPSSPPFLLALFVASPIHPTTTVLDAALQVGMESEEKKVSPQEAELVPCKPLGFPRSHRTTSLGAEAGCTDGSLNRDSSSEDGEFRSFLGFGSASQNPSREVMRKLDNNRGEFAQSSVTPSPPPVISPSAQIVLRNLERCSMASAGKHAATVPKPHDDSNNNNHDMASAGKHAAAGPKPHDNNNNHHQLRALRTREIRRSSEGFASYSSNVRVTPVLNVPQVCIGGPTIRSSGSSKGHLARLRSLFFKKKNSSADCKPPLMPRKIVT